MLSEHYAQLLAKAFGPPFPYNLILVGVIIVALLVWMGISAQNKRAK
jgi:hypothetical protein